MSNIKLFESTQIRTVWNETEQKWYFVVADVVQVLTEPPNPGDYIKKMRKRDEELSKGWGQIVPTFWWTPQAVSKNLIAIREELTDQWKNRGVKAQREYSILTAEISKATFGLTPSEYKKVKGLKSQNLRDHMNDLELIFSMLGEASTTAIVRTPNPKGFVENQKVARQGGAVAGKARKDLKQRQGKK